MPSRWSADAGGRRLFESIVWCDPALMRSSRERILDCIDLALRLVLSWSGFQGGEASSQGEPECPITLFQWLRLLISSCLLLQPVNYDYDPAPWATDASRIIAAAKSPSCDGNLKLAMINEIAELSTLSERPYLDE